MRLLRHQAGTDTATIGLAIGVASVAGYVLLVAAGRMLSPGDYALFVSFWAVLFGIGSSMSLIEQDTARQAAGDAGRGPSVRATAVAAAVIGGSVATLTALPPVAQRLYGTSSPVMGALVVVATVGFAVQFAVRGVLIGSGRVRPYGLLVTAEAVTRLAALAAIALAVRDVGLVGVAVAVVVGSFAWAGWVRAARRTTPTPPTVPAVTLPTPPAGRHWPAAARRAASLMAAAALTAALVTGYPALVSALSGGGSNAAAGAVFAALTISRVPLLLVSPVQALAVPLVVRWRTGTGAVGVRPARLVVLGTAVALGVALLGGGAGWLLGPAAVRLLYGPAYQVPGPAAGLLVLSAVLLAWALLLSAVLVGLAAHRRMLLMWISALAATAAWLLLSPLDVVATTAVGAFVGPVVGLVVALAVLAPLLRATPAVGGVGTAVRPTDQDGTAST